MFLSRFLSTILLVLPHFGLLRCDSTQYEDKFLYFAYGSNLLAKRIHINNPTAIFYSTAKLQDYRLDFNMYTELWNGNAATIVEDPGEYVWGDLWLINNSDLKSLDEQELVGSGGYFARNVTVTTPGGKQLQARTYQETVDPPKLKEGELLPEDRRPSNTYLGVIILGAFESNLPSEYIGKLFNFVTNGNTASKPILEQLGYPFNVKHLQYKIKTSKFIPVQQALIASLNSTITELENIWNTVDNWVDNESLFPDKNGDPGRILHAIKSSPIALVDNAPKGTQLKLLLILESKQKVLFKPKRYNLTEVIKGPVYAGFDRYNSEVFAYYLGMVLNMRWIAPAVTMRINVENDILPVATLGLKNTMVKNGKEEWKLSHTLSLQRILNLIDVAIFDFLIQNGDRHHYEVYKNRIVILDNGKGLGNPMVDILDVLAPLYQCCIINLQTWQNLQLLSGGSLTETIKILSSFQGEKLATEEHFEAIERRLLKVYATVQYCIEKYGTEKVFKHNIELMLNSFSRKMMDPIKDTFLYFAYGSNLFKKRIRINNPTAEFLGVGRLDNHQLDFIKYSEHWRGASATIIPTEHAHVWGAIWRLHDQDLPSLDRQEGVDTNWYFAKSVNVMTSDGVSVQCRTYQQTINPPLRKNGEELPLERRPCITYLDCIIKGAVECELPEYYIEELKKIPHNGQIASAKMLEKLNSQ
ncbi:uncharacterized protein LOC101743698 [Bombyx mori]|uniref:uncharacterized protein LOC101743698 n=1 Tax=Bombyx mori TaxID=7091 RepID=UPI002ED112B1